MTEATESIRPLIREISLTSNGDDLHVHFKGMFAEMLAPSVLT